jgi:hypothetical protein
MNYTITCQQRQTLAIEGGRITCEKSLIGCVKTCCYRPKDKPEWLPRENTRNHQFGEVEHD